MMCQLQSLEGAVTDFTIADKLHRRIVRNIIYLFKAVKMLFSTCSKSSCFEPARPSSSADSMLDIGSVFATKTFNVKSSPIVADKRITSGVDELDDVVRQLNLQPGDTVKVKSLEKIKSTLDANGKFQGLSYTPAMEIFCGGTYTVFKRIEHAFDERKWKLSKMKNVVILVGVYCDGQGGMEKAWTGCDRSCFIWWKEAWLERT